MLLFLFKHGMLLARVPMAPETEIYFRSDILQCLPHLQ